MKEKIMAKKKVSKKSKRPTVEQLYEEIKELRERIIKLSVTQNKIVKKVKSISR